MTSEGRDGEWSVGWQLLALTAKRTNKQHRLQGAQSHAADRCSFADAACGAPRDDSRSRFTTHAHTHTRTRTPSDLSSTAAHRLGIDVRGRVILSAHPGIHADAAPLVTLTRDYTTTHDWRISHASERRPLTATWLRAIRDPDYCDYLTHSCLLMAGCRARLHRSWMQASLNVNARS